jgi:serine/threonine protein kinase
LKPIHSVSANAGVLFATSGSNSDGERPSSPIRRTIEAEDALLPLAQIERLGFDSHGGRSELQLFSSFVSLAYNLAHEEPKDPVVVDLLDRLRNKDLGVLNMHLITIGYGSSFVVSIMTTQDDIPGLDAIVLKRTIPSTAAQSGGRVRKRIESLMLELRVLTHGPIRKHENIVEFLGVAWETDPLDLQRRWPVLIMEQATKGTLNDFLQPSDPKPFRIKTALALDVVLGLKVLHQCGVLHGDIKTDNVLVFENQDPETWAERPVIAKLADFSGVLFDMKNPMALPSGTRPWNAPEWRQNLTPDSLLKTDLYSLGFLIFRIMVDGKHPFLDFSFPADDSWSRVDILKEDDDKMQTHMKSLSGFSEDVDVRALHAILDCTLRFDPILRNLDSVEKILQETSYQHR